MRVTTHKVKTSVIPADLAPLEIREASRGIALFYTDGRFMSQGFFTPPLVGQLNWVEGLTSEADVHFREIAAIGANLFHVRVVGNEDRVRKMLGDPSFFLLLKGISTTLNEEVRSRWYIETTRGKDRWNALVSLDKNLFYLANYVSLRGKKERIHNIIVVGDWLLGRTDKGEVVLGQLTPDLLEKKDALLQVTLAESVNKLGRVDLLEPIPNAEDSFLATVGNTIYAVDIWGDVIPFNMLEERVKEVKSIGFNRARSVLATNEGIFEVDVREMPNVVKVASLPRQVVHPDLRKGFKMAQYVEDPYVLGIHPAMSIFAKTEDERVLCF